MLAAAGIPVAAADMPATLDSTCLDSLDNMVWAEEAGEDCVRDVLREYAPDLVPVPRQGDRKVLADTSDEWATYCRTVRL